jgi:hypothetical protein
MFQEMVATGLKDSKCVCGGRRHMNALGGPQLSRNSLSTMHNSVGPMSRE